MTRKVIIPNHHVYSSPGVYEYAISATTAEMERKEKDYFFDKLARRGGRVIDEYREIRPNNIRYIVYTYEI